MRCPRCGFEQDPGPECVRCGVVFKKVDAGNLPPGIDVGDIPGLEPEEGIVAEERDLKEVVLFTSQFKIQGKVRTATKGYRGRISDMLNDDSTQFLVVQDAKVSTIEGEIKVPFTPVVVVNKQDVHFAVPS